jgi:hypothetical protein
MEAHLLDNVGDVGPGEGEVLEHCSLSGAPSGAALTLRELSAHCSHLQATVGVDCCA